MTMVNAIMLLVFPSLMAYAASSDLLTMRISNYISASLIAGFLLLALASGMSFREIGIHFLAGGMMLCLTFLCFWRGWVGGGDAKLASATALWFGFDYLYDYVLLASVLGGGLTLLLLRFRQAPVPESFLRHAWVARLHDQHNGVPYGIALAAAALLIYPYTGWMKVAGF